MFWKLPPKIKIYEALGCIADGRLEIEDNSAKVWSSNRDKYYDVKYDPKTNAIACNDNGSYWVGYLGYPAIAFLMQKEIIPYQHEYAQALKGIEWKTINTKFKNDFTKTEALVGGQMETKGIDLKKFDVYVEQVLEKIADLKLKKLGPQAKPPKE